MTRDPRLGDAPLASARLRFIVPGRPRPPLGDPRHTPFDPRPARRAIWIRRGIQLITLAALTYAFWRMLP